jgi:HEAT repeat protein
MALSDQAPAVRIQVVRALPLVEGIRAIQALQGRLLRDPDAGVRLAAARALEAVPTPSAMAALSAAASDADPSVRREIAAALQRRRAAAR